MATFSKKSTQLPSKISSPQSPTTSADYPPKQGTARDHQTNRNSLHALCSHTLSLVHPRYAGGNRANCRLPRHHHHQPIIYGDNVTIMSPRHVNVVNLSRHATSVAFLLWHVVKCFEMWHFFVYRPTSTSSYSSHKRISVEHTISYVEGGKSSATSVACLLRVLVADPGIVRQAMPKTPVIRGHN